MYIFIYFLFDYSSWSTYNTQIQINCLSPICSVFCICSVICILLLLLYCPFTIFSLNNDMTGFSKGFSQTKSIAQYLGIDCGILLLLPPSFPPLPPSWGSLFPTLGAKTYLSIKFGTIPTKIEGDISNSRSNLKHVSSRLSGKLFRMLLF